MGEKLDSFEKSAAQEKDSKRLDVETFSQLSQTVEGLSSVPENVLEEYLYTTDEIEDIEYIFKFLSDREIFLRIATEENSSFHNLNVEEQEKVRLLGSYFHSFLAESPTLNEITKIDLGERGFFIAYVNKKGPRLDIAWKNEEDRGREKVHLLHKLLEKVNASGENYPDNLRSTGQIEIFEDGNGVINIKFVGDASKGYLKYAPGYLKSFEEEIENHFKEEFEGEKIKVHF